MKEERSEKYPDWIKTPMGLWKNIKTGKESAFPPEAIFLGNLIYKSHERLISSLKKNPPKGIVIKGKP